MKAWAVAWIVMNVFLSLAAAGALAYGMGIASDLSADLERERAYNAVQRWVRLRKAHQPDVNVICVQQAATLYNVPADVLVALRRLEYGAPGYENGYQAKTAINTKLAETDCRQYYEAARLANSFAWEYCLGPDQEKAFCELFAKRYNNSKAWREYAKEFRMLLRQVKRGT